MLNRKSINSHLADYSVNAAPEGFEPKSFIKKYIGSINNDIFITLESWVKSQWEYDLNYDFILQMDVEGAEYQIILSTPDEILKRFRIITMEVHNVESWGQRHFFDIVEAAFDKLLQHFHVVHNHPNNYRGLIDFNGFIAPEVFELTLLRKDRSEVKGYCDTFPNDLDRPNNPAQEELILPDNWCKV